MEKLQTNIFNLNSLQTIFRHAIYSMLACIVITTLHNASLMNFYEEDILILIYIIIGVVAFGLAFFRIIKFNNKTPKAEYLATKIFSVLAYIANAIVVCYFVLTLKYIDTLKYLYGNINQQQIVILLITVVILCAPCYLFAFNSIKSIAVKISNSAFLLCILAIISMLTISLFPTLDFTFSNNIRFIIMIIAFILPLLALLFLYGRKCYDFVTKENFDRERFKNIQDNFDLFGLSYLVFLYFSLVSIVYVMNYLDSINLEIYSMFSLAFIVTTYFIFYWIYYFVYKCMGKTDEKTA